MGLDICAYKNVSLVECLPEYEDFEEKYYDADWNKIDNYAYVWVQDGLWKSRATPIIHHGVYLFGDAFSFRAGSYSGYNWWRDELSKMFIGVSAREVWNNREAYQNAPFFEIVDFSDCEGIIGTEVSEKLLADFEANVEQASTHQESWFFEAYKKWMNAFKYASENGYVDFR